MKNSKDIDIFKAQLANEPEANELLNQVAESLPKPIQNKASQYSIADDIVLITVVYPVASFITQNMLLPWLYEAKKFSDIWLKKLDDWVNKLYIDQEVDPIEAEITANKIREKLEKIQNPQTQASWESLAQSLLNKQLEQVSDSKKREELKRLLELLKKGL